MDGSVVVEKGMVVLVEVAIALTVAVVQTESSCSVAAGWYPLHVAYVQLPKWKS